MTCRCVIKCLYSKLTSVESHATEALHLGQCTADWDRGQKGVERRNMVAAVKDSSTADESGDRCSLED